MSCRTLVDLSRRDGDDRGYVIAVVYLVVVDVSVSAAAYDNLGGSYRNLAVAYAVCFQKVAHDFVLSVYLVVDGCHVVAYLLEHQWPYHTIGIDFAFGKTFDGNGAVSVFDCYDATAESCPHDDEAGADADTRECFVESFHAEIVFAFATNIQYYI